MAAGRQVPVRQRDHVARAWIASTTFAVLDALAGYLRISRSRNPSVPANSGSRSPRHRHRSYATSHSIRLVANRLEHLTVGSFLGLSLAGFVAPLEFLGDSKEKQYGYSSS